MQGMRIISQSVPNYIKQSVDLVHDVRNKMFEYIDMVKVRYEKV